MSHKAFCLNSILCFFRSLWHGILVVASFIQNIIFKLQQSGSRLKEVALKHCNLSLHVSRLALRLMILIILKVSKALLKIGKHSHDL